MHAFESQLLADWPLDRWHDVTVLVAVSAGPDSVALLRAILALSPSRQIVVGHFNHQLRGAESNADQQFVAKLATQLNLPVDLGSGNPAGIAEQGDGIEAAARAQRYEFLQAAAERRGARYLATGHTADDQVETVLHRLLRGTGIAGLAGMPRVRRLSPATTLVRPMLARRRAEVLGYLAALGQPYRVDSTNIELTYTRNRLRHDLLPRLERDYNPRVAEAVLRLCRLAGEAQETIDFTVGELMARALTIRATLSATATESNPQVSIDCRKLVGQPRHLIRELLIRVWRSQGWPEQSMGLSEWERLADLCRDVAVSPPSTVPISRSRKHVLPGGILGERRGDLLYLTVVSSTESAIDHPRDDT